MADFVARLVTWQKAHGRHDLPWQLSRDPYRVWLSEIMLQQTQVNTVLAYYQRFLKRFPTVESLAAVEQEELMPYWAGLGYYARARNLHRCAQIICQEFAGQFPSDPEALQRLPGIGKSTANAIAAFCFDAPTPIMDGNVKRVFTRYYGITGTGSATEKQLWLQADDNAQGQAGLGSYNQALMDLGANICKRSKPLCTRCPLQHDCYAFKHNAQAELPTRKAKKTIPIRYCHMLVLQKGSRVLLQTRPSKGIWGGLLSLPEFSDAPELEQTLVAQGLEVGQTMAAFEHVFSHFRLIIQPQLVRLVNPPRGQALDHYLTRGREYQGEPGNKPGDEGEYQGEPGNKPDHEGEHRGEHEDKPGHEGEHRGEHGGKPGHESEHQGEHGNKPGHEGEHQGEHEEEHIVRTGQAKPSIAHSPTLSIHAPSVQLAGDWYEINQVETLALPAPVLKILQGIRGL